MEGKLLSDRYYYQKTLGNKAGRTTILALDQQTETQVVIKLLTFSDEFQWEDLRLFEREIQTLRSLDHPAIPKYLDSFEIDDAQGKNIALVQNYIPAKSLAEYIADGRIFTESEVRELLNALLDILSYLHDRHPPVIHRDIKPSNILLGDRSGHSIGQVYLVDFGSVQTLATRAGQTMTVVGTYGYMPPEQFGGSAVPASDLYSLGCTAISLLTSSHPADLPQLNLQIQFAQEVNLSPDFISWLQKITHPSLDQRFTQVETAKQELNQSRLIKLKSSPLAPQKPMNTRLLVWNFVWRSAVMGASAGAILGILAIIFGTAIVSLPFIQGVISVGFSLGLFNGIIAAIFTHFRPSISKSYPLQVGVVSFTGCLVLLVGMSGLIVDFFRDILLLLIYKGMLIIIPALLMGFISHDIGRWYQRYRK